MFCSMLNICLETCNVLRRCISLNFSVGNWWANIATVYDTYVTYISKYKTDYTCGICFTYWFKKPDQTLCICCRLSWTVLLNPGKVLCKAFMIFTIHSTTKTLMYIVIYHINNRNDLICRWKIYSYHNKNVLSHG